MASSARASGGLGAKLFERFFYDFSLYDRYFKPRGIEHAKYVALRHNLGMVTGFYVLLTAFFPFNPSFATMGYEGTWVTEPNKGKAVKEYEQWKATGKWKPTPEAKEK